MQISFTLKRNKLTMSIEFARWQHDIEHCTTAVTSLFVAVTYFLFRSLVYFYVQECVISGTSFVYFYDLQHFVSNLIVGR